MRIRALLLVVAAACGAKSAPPEQPDLDGDGAGSGSGARSSQVLPQPLVDATKGQPLYIDDFTTLALFADERREAQQIIATWATANGLTILAPAVVEAIVDKANHGLDPASGAACGPSLNRELALDRWVTAAGHMKASVYCQAECTIQLEIHLRKVGTEYFAAAFDPSKPWREELAHRLATLVDNGGHDRYGHANNPVPVAGVPRAAGADDLVSDPDAALDLGADGVAIAKQCGLTGLGVGVLVDAGAGGAPRCERSGDSSYVAETDPTIIACACAQVATRVKPAKRQLVRLAPPTATPYRLRTKSGLWASAELIGGNEYRSFGVAWFWPGQISYNVSHCFVGRTAVEEGKELNATLDFDRDGKVVTATVADVNGLLQPGEGECLQAAMKALRTPCPTEPNPTGTTRISWRISDQP